jgi:hypothetical protein
MPEAVIDEIAMNLDLPDMPLREIFAQLKKYPQF